MDFDFKIGAVFSLADDRKESHDSHRTDLYDDPGQSLPDRDENGKVGINLYGSETNSENTFLLSGLLSICWKQVMLKRSLFAKFLR